jgi:hypothetical protein
MDADKISEDGKNAQIEAETTQGIEEFKNSNTEESDDKIQQNDTGIYQVALNK